jgi:DNA-binding response OmpR family regulator
MVVLDLRLPDIDGLDVTRTLRKDANLPSSCSPPREETDKLVHLELGADDCMTKPFSPKRASA